MSDSYELAPEAVRRSGQAVARYATDASGLGRLYLSRLETTDGELLHPAVLQAVERYRDRWQPFVTEVAAEVDALGTNTATVAVTITAADQDAASLLSRPAADIAEQSATMSRDINTPF